MYPSKQYKAKTIDTNAIEKYSLIFLDIKKLIIERNIKTKEKI